MAAGAVYAQTAVDLDAGRRLCADHQLLPRRAVAGDDGVITGVGFLIHLYSTGYMADEEGYSRFFAYMNLFVAAMLILVLGDNLLLLFLGWEGVGLCSYLLIGFWYRRPGQRRRRAQGFVVTRVGDTAMALGLFLLFREFGTLDIQALLARVPPHAGRSASMTAVTATALLLLGGAVGKSAQLPLHTWLPDAMAGPTPVSALIHAATMVTAGVYLVARTHELFLLAPPTQLAVAVVGLLTLFIAGLHGADPARHQAHPRLLDHQPDRLHVPGAGRRRLERQHLPPDDPRLLQGAAVPGRRLGHSLALHHEQDIFKMGGLWHPPAGGRSGASSSAPPRWRRCRSLPASTART